MRVKDIPKEKLREIRRFAIQSKGKLTYEQMAEEVRRRFGVELKPHQIYGLTKPKSRKVSVPEDVVDFLEREFGSVGEGVRQVASLVRQMSRPPPEHLKEAVARLAGEKLSYDEACTRLRELGYEDPHPVIRELGRLGFMVNEDGMLKFFRLRRPPELSILNYVMGANLRAGGKRG